MKAAALVRVGHREHRRRPKLLFAALALTGAFATSAAAAQSAATIPGATSHGQGDIDDAACQLLKLQRAVPRAKGPWSPADHSKFKALEGPFKSPREVTSACLTCHTDAAKQVKATIHWTWSKERNPNTKPMIGKANVLQHVLRQHQEQRTILHDLPCRLRRSRSLRISFRSTRAQTTKSTVSSVTTNPASTRKFPSSAAIPATERTRVAPRLQRGLRDRRAIRRSARPRCRRAKRRRAEAGELRRLPFLRWRRRRR